MILQSVILAIACTSSVMSGANQYTLGFNVSRGLCSQVVGNSNNSTYVNTYFDLQGCYADFESGTLSNISLNNINLICEFYNNSDTLSETKYYSFNSSAFENLNFYNDNNYFNIEVYDNNTLRYSLYCSNTFVDYIDIDFDFNIVTSHNRCNFDFLEDNFYTYYAFNVGDNSYVKGYQKGYNEGNENGLSVGYNNGYVDGFNDGVDSDSTVYAIFGGLTSVAMLPIDVFLKMLNFTILGINFSDLVMGLLTGFVIVFLVRFILGRKE